MGDAERRNEEETESNIILAREKYIEGEGMRRDMEAPKAATGMVMTVDAQSKEKERTTGRRLERTAFMVRELAPACASESTGSGLEER